jgi:hypothetical protein
MFAVALSVLALAGAAASVPVSGGTPAERAIVRQALPAVDSGVVTSARLDGRKYLVLGPLAPRAPGVLHDRAFWEAQAFVATVAARLDASGERIAGYTITGAFGGPGSPQMGPAGARRLRAVVLANARAAGIAVRRARVLAIGGGVLDVTVRLREDQLLDPGLTTALRGLFGPVTIRPGPLHFLSVEAPDGTAVAYGGTFVNGGSWSYGGDTGRSPVPRTIPRRIWRASTDLVVQMTRDIGLESKRSFGISCQGTLPPARGTLCRRVLADRWALLVPDAGFACAGSPAGAWNVSIKGTFAGQTVNLTYDGCFGGTVQRWARVLDLAQ